MVADHQDARAPPLGQLGQEADGDVKSSDHLTRGGIPFRPVDPGLIDIQVAPGAVLEWVEVLELDHQHRPVGDDPIGEQSPLRAAAEALGGEPGVFGQLVERLRARFQK